MRGIRRGYSVRSKCEQAEETHRQALGLQETVVGKEHPDTLTSMANLARVLIRRASTSRRKR
jgi:hypothetical protein